MLLFVISVIIIIAALVLAKVYNVSFSKNQIALFLTLFYMLFTVISIILYVADLEMGYNSASIIPLMYKPFSSYKWVVPAVFTFISFVCLIFYYFLSALHIKNGAVNK